MYENVTWHAGEDCEGWCVDDANDLTNADNLNDVDVVSWWCNAGGDNIAGVAYLGGLCSDVRSNLNEKQDTVMQSGYVCIDI